MPFMQESDLNILFITRALASLLLEDDWSCYQFLKHPLVSGSPEGIAADTRAWQVELARLELTHPDAAAEVRAVPWMSDGVSLEEEKAAHLLYRITRESKRTWKPLLERPWVQDGIAGHEIEMLFRIRSLTTGMHAQSDEPSMIRLLEMPFLQSSDGATPAALLSLGRLVIRDTDGFRELLTAAVSEQWSEGPASFNLSGWQCDLVANISGLEELQRERGSPGYRELIRSGCHYRLGEGLFRELRSIPGDAEFRRGFAKLYQLRKDREGPDRCYGFRWAICYVEKAFVRDASSTQKADIAQRVINKWYDETPLQ